MTDRDYYSLSHSRHDSEASAHVIQHRHRTDSDRPDGGARRQRAVIATEVTAIEAHLGRLPGVGSVSINATGETTTDSFDPVRTSGEGRGTVGL